MAIVPRDQRGFVLRIAPSTIDRLEEALRVDQLIIGWSEAEGLLDAALSPEEFRSRLGRVYYPNEKSKRRAGAAAGNMWRFIREMQAGDLVVVPRGPEFYVARVAGPAVYLADHRESDTAYRRPVEWLNGKRGIPRHAVRAALQSRLKIQGTSVDATDLLLEIREYANWKPIAEPTFESDVIAAMVARLLNEIRTGRIENFGFERLLRSVLLGLGAKDVKILPRQLDKGADLVASFRIASAFDLTVAVQAKHFQPEPAAGPEVIDQLARGMEAESADLGIAITSGTFSPDAHKRAEQLYDSDGLRIELVDGEQLASLIIENGLVGKLSAK